MRKLGYLFAIGSFSAFLLTSCTKDEAVSTDDAATVVASSLSSQDGATSFSETGIAGLQDSGLKTAASPSNTVASTTYSYKTITNAVKDTSATITDGTRTWTYSKAYTLTTKLQIATTGSTIVTTVDSLLASLTYSGTFNGPKLSSTHKGSGNAVFTNIGTYKNVNTNWTLNGTYDRSGSSTVKASGNTITHTTHIVLTNVVVNHKTKAIASGTATLTISGTDKNKSFSFTGTITFNGDTTAKLIIDGKTYSINLTTGEII